MARLIFLLAVAVVVGWILFKLIRSGSSARDRVEEDTSGAEAPPDGVEDAKLVRCGQCGAYVPRSDALTVAEGFRCGEPTCGDGGR